MVLVNKAINEVTVKLVYYGPGLCGKTTNLEKIYGNPKLENKGKMISMATETDRTLFFDFMPMELGTIGGQKVRVQLYTVPGQVIYNSTRQLVLRSVDGVVFVADSQWEKMEENVGSFRNLEQNLQKQNLPLDQVPVVLQFNKRDLPNVAPANYLEYLLNNRKRRLQSFECVASTGANVFSALDAVTQLLLHKFKRENTSLFPGPGKQTAR